MSKYFLFTSRMRFSQTIIPGLLFSTMLNCTQSSFSPTHFQMYEWEYWQKASRYKHQKHNTKSARLGKKRKWTSPGFPARTRHKTKYFQIRHARLCSQVRHVCPYLQTRTWHQRGGKITKLIGTRVRLGTSCLKPEPQFCPASNDMKTAPLQNRVQPPVLRWEDLPLKWNNNQLVSVLSCSH